MFKFADSKLNIAEVWGAGFKLFKTTFGKVWFFTLILEVIIVAIVTLIIKKFAGLFILFRLTSDAAHVPTGLVWAVLGVFMIIGLVTLLFKSTILDRIATVVLTSDVSISKSIVHVLSKYLILLFSMVIMFFVIFAAMLVLAGLPALLGPVAANVGANIWMLFTIFISFAFMFNIPLILFDNKGAMGSLGDSFKLVAGNWWRNFIVFFVPALILTMCQLVLMFIIRNIIADCIIMGIAFIFTVPYFQSLILVQFNDLKLRSKK